MENQNTMTWGNFKSLLAPHTNKHLEFRYAENSLVAPSYHITEIKFAPITSVDCSGKMNQWNEVIVQLWEPSGESKDRAMTVAKALSIVDVVEKVLPMDSDATVKIEFGNSAFDARQMYPGQLIESGDSVIIDLMPDFTQCKALGRGGSCGTTEAGEECSEPAQPKPHEELKNLAATSCCVPGSGCC